MSQLKFHRTNALNTRLGADHVCPTPDGGNRRRVIGTSAPGPKATWRAMSGVSSSPEKPANSAPKFPKLEDHPNVAVTLNIQINLSGLKASTARLSRSRSVSWRCCLVAHIAGVQGERQKRL